MRISYSAISDWQRCPRYYAYRHVLKRVRLGSSGRALGFGRAGHKGQEALWGWDGDPADPGRLQAAVDAFLTAADEEKLSFEDRMLGQVLLIGYAARWDDLRLSYHMAPLVERRVTTPVLRPSGTPADDLEIVAVFDVVAYDTDGSTVPVEHKFTSSDISPGAAYWSRLDLNLQASIYWLVASDAGREPRVILWDAIRAPETKRLLATPRDKREFYKRATKRADGSMAAVGDPKPGVRLVDETADELTQRMMDRVLANPLDYYGRGEVYRSEDELARVRADLWQVGRQMQQSVDGEYFPRNLDGCHKYGTVCPYLPVCKGEVTIDDDRVYTIREREEKPVL